MYDMFFDASYNSFRFVYSSGLRYRWVGLQVPRSFSGGRGEPHRNVHAGRQARVEGTQ